MVINDLKTICPVCKGAGRTAGITNLGIAQINPGGVCARCSGKGFLLTELGEDLLKLLRPFILEMIKKEAKPPEARNPPPPAPAGEEGS